MAFSSTEPLSFSGTSCQSSSLSCTNTNLMLVFPPPIHDVHRFASYKTDNMHDDLPSKVASAQIFASCSKARLEIDNRNSTTDSCKNVTKLKLDATSHSNHT